RSRPRTYDEAAEAVRACGARGSRRGGDGVGWHDRDRIAAYAEEPGASVRPLCRLTEMGEPWAIEG
uniref:hypothetical protein n=1 Tax=Streptomyces brasiliscabiei TaxID=2736302 RepID=UPI001C10AE8E